MWARDALLVAAIVGLACGCGKPCPDSRCSYTFPPAPSMSAATAQRADPDDGVPTASPPPPTEEPRPAPPPRPTPPPATPTEIHTACDGQPGCPRPLGRCGDLAEDFGFYACTYRIANDAGGVSTGDDDSRCQSPDEISEEMDHRCQAGAFQDRDPTGHLGNRCVRYAVGDRPSDGTPVGYSYVGTGADSYARDSVNWCVP